MTTTLHAIWLPSELSGSGIGLALWGEGGRPRRPPSPHEHPGSLSHQAIETRLSELDLYMPFIYRGERGTHLTLALPSDEARPIAFRHEALAASRPQKRRKRSGPSVRAWRVPAVIVPTPQVLPFLLRLPESSTRVTFGPGLSYWRRAARLVAAALIRGEYLPCVDAGGAGRWELILADGDLQHAAAELAGAMPASARALARPTPSPAALLDDFIVTVGHEFLSHAYTPGQTPFKTHYHSLHGPQSPRPADQWWMGLFPRSHHYFNSLQTSMDRSEFAERVREWMGPVRQYVASPYRLTLRLEPPGPSDSIDAADAAWRLSIHLQPKDQSGVLWAAAEVWENAPRPDMPAALRSGLSRAAQLYPRLSPALEQERPAEVWLTTHEAVAFLGQHGPELDAQGVGVLVPAWWKQRSRKLKTRLSLGKWGEATGLFGMDALVDFDWKLAVGDQALGLDEFMALAQSKASLVQVRGEWVELDPEEVRAALQLIQRHAKSGGKLAMREALGLALAGPGEWEGLELESVQVDGWLDEAARRLTGRHPVERLPQPASFAGQLRPYQLNGFSWLNFMRQWGFGACLADDMGLGKTIQVLALLSRDLDDGRLDRPVLLVCPTTVVINWVREAARFVPGLRCYAHHGPKRLRKDEFVRAVAEHHLVVTSYALLPRDFEFIESVAWGGVVLDEAHNIKNPNTKQARSARGLRAGYRVALTGTPVENRLQDLWSTMHFLNPGYLGSSESFQRQFALPIERGTDPTATGRLRALTGPFLLRRLKTDTAIIHDLPPKNEMKEYCGLTKEQAALYRAVVQESLRQIAAADGIRRRGIILATLTKLKQVCNHPRHLLGDLSPLKHRSGKLNRLSEMLEQALAEDDRVLIFTQYAEMGALLHDHLREAFGEALYLYGGTPAAKRAEMIERFQNGGPRLFVLSLKAGGAGINLTRANRVFHYDRWWNPAVENQATDRAFRIGQTRSVQVHKFICRGTLEERVDELIAHKVALAEQVVGSGEEWLTELTTDELRDLLLLRHDAVDD